MIKKGLLYVCCLAAVCLSGRALGQDKITPEDLQLLKGYENDMVLITDSMYNAPILDLRSVYCEQLARMLVRALKVPNSFEYPFEKLGERINIIMPDDKAFRIFNWTMLHTEVTLRYYGAIQMNSPQLKLYPLIDAAMEIGKSFDDSVLTGDRWFGALYYRIMTHEEKGMKYYTLFGVNKGNVISTRKVMDFLSFTPQGPVFGAPVFQVRELDGTFSMKHRFVLEYKKEVNSSLNWDNERKLVVFDRLISQVNDPNRKYTYVPSGQYDGLRWREGRWIWVDDLIPIQDMKDGDAPAPKPVKK